MVKKSAQKSLFEIPIEILNLHKSEITKIYSSTFLLLQTKCSINSGGNEFNTHMDWFSSQW